ncbi:hypothetical protein EB796_004327 [Bugula neritina]|uniref:Uncharacterized protein n=1 Tax=Bugula neritina TaxID=10212 RepID=A0A7J7KGJ5_BUGNE|nr:hypothetical protein EB796_004327 [Bugula neritina]
MVTKEINKLKDNTAAFKQTGLDVKFVADRLMSKINGDPKRVPENLVTANGEVSVQRSSDSEESDEELEETIALEV